MSEQKRRPGRSRLSPGEASVFRAVKLPESLAARIRALAEARGSGKEGEVMRELLEAALPAAEEAEFGQAS